MGAPGGRVTRPWLLASVSLCACLAVAQPAWAQTRAFRIEAQPAATGIREFASQAGVQVIAAQNVVRNKRVNAVAGDYTPIQALNVLLRDTGLEAVGAPPEIVLIRQAQTPPPPQDTGPESVVIVTAQKRSEPLQTVPASVQVVSGRRIDQQGLGTYKDVIQMLSGVTVREHSDPRSVGLIVRGVGSSQSFTGIEPDAAVNIDGEVLSRSSALYNDINDIDSVAVLKGPQGTLFGKNSVAGVLQIRTRRPSLKGNAGTLQVLTDQGIGTAIGQVNIAGTYNYVVDDSSAARISLFGKRDSGWVENVMGGPDGGQSDGYGGRFQYLKRLDDETEFLLRADYQRSNFGPGTRVYIQRDDFVVGEGYGQIPQAAIDSLNLTPEALQALLVSNIHRVSKTPYGQWNDKLSTSRVRDYGGTKSFGVSGELTRRFASGYELTWAAFYRDEWLDSNDDSVATAVNAFPLNFAGRVQSATHQSELRIASPVGGRFDYVAGAFYLQSEVRRNQKVLACQDPGLNDSTFDADLNVVTCGGYDFGWGISNPGVTGLDNLIYNREVRNNVLRTHNAALFAQGNYHLNDQLTFVLGGRVLHEAQRFRLDVRDDGVANTDVRPTLLWVYGADGNRVVFPQGRFNIPNPFFGRLSDNPATDLDVRNPDAPFVTQSKRNSDNALTYKLAVLYRLARDVMLYGNYSTGYKGVAWFTDSDVRQKRLDAKYPIPPETSQNIELGLRTQAFDRRLTFNATLFHTRFYHYQERLMTLDYDLFPIVNGGLQNIANDPMASGQAIRNYAIVDAGNLVSKGVDIELEWRPTKAWTLSANYSHVDARFSHSNVLITCNAAARNGADTSMCGDPINYGEFYDWTFPRRGSFFSLNGAQLANSPADTLAADATYEFDLGRFPSYVRWNYRFASEQYTFHGGKANNDYSTTTPSYGIHNLFLGVSSPGGKYRFSLFVKNLFDQHYYVYKTNYGDGLAEQAVGGSLTTVPELVGVAQAYPTYGAVPNGQFFRQRAENGNVLKDFNRYVGVSFEMKF